MKLINYIATDTAGNLVPAVYDDENNEVLRQDGQSPEDCGALSMPNDGDSYLIS